MAVEAHHLLHHHAGTGGGQALVAHAGWAAAAGGAMCGDAAPAAHHPQQERRRYGCPGYGGREVAAAAGRMSQQGYGQQQPSCAGLVGPASSPMAGQYAQPACASESGVTFGGGGGGAQEAAPRKRKRAEQGQPAAAALGLSAADVAAHSQQQLLDVDRLVLHHTAKMWAELTEQRRRHARQVVAAVEAAAARRLRAKDEEMERIGRLNWALEERVKSLYVEAQVWRDLAQSNEAAANALRGELQQALASQQARCVLPGADDAASCCCGENDVGAGAGDEEEDAGTPGRRCRACGEGAAEVLLLPCRHLCACAPCAAAARACPACGCAKNGTVCVNFS